jgi:chorismate-pyruvate lyase
MSLSGEEMTACYLSAEDIRKLDRDLQILIATNGTLTRILEIVSDEEIDVKIIDQQTHQTPPKIHGLEEFPAGQVLRRQVLLTGRRSGVPFVAAESFIAADHLPPTITTTLTETNRPIGEIVLSSCIETYKDAAKVWVAALPDWTGISRDPGQRSTAYARRYRIITRGLPVISISEYFLADTF